MKTSGYLTKRMKRAQNEGEKEDGGGEESGEDMNQSL